MQNVGSTGSGGVTLIVGGAVNEEFGYNAARPGVGESGVAGFAAGGRLRSFPGPILSFANASDSTSMPACPFAGARVSVSSTCSQDTASSYSLLELGEWSGVGTFVDMVMVMVKVSILKRAMKWWIEMLGSLFGYR